jgi:hypothetical protein
MPMVGTSRKQGLFAGAWLIYGFAPFRFGLRLGNSNLFSKERSATSFLLGR